MLLRFLDIFGRVHIWLSLLRLPSSIFPGTSRGSLRVPGPLDALPCTGSPGFPGNPARRFHPRIVRQRPDFRAKLPCLEAWPENLDPTVVYVQVENSPMAAGLIADNFFGQPSAQLKVVGVTGTNGKTTIATLLFKLFTAMGYKCGLLSTVENMIGETIIPATHTTPDAIQLHSLLRQMKEEECSHVFMEVSSHAIHQHRIAGLQFAGGLFSNITAPRLSSALLMAKAVDGKPSKKAFFTRMYSSNVW
ncbi:MAG: hypothetical protein EOO88_61115 [Pedobacter sp.]|nr:MAG: hypothetical protein EOO88_61115 [Pedobacter sp.]